MRTLVLGNSHTLALDDANRARPAGLRATRDVFFMHGPWHVASDGSSTIVHLTEKPTRRDVPGASQRVDVSQYDCLVVSACGWAAPRNRIVDVADPIHPLGVMACTGWDHDERVVPPTVQLVSRSVFHATVEAWVRRLPALRLALKLAPVFKAPILIQPWPAPNVSQKHNADWVLNKWYGAQGATAWAEYFAAQYAAVRRIFSQSPGRFIVLDYPVAGAALDGFMDASWCDADPFHANAQYGELVLEQIDAMQARGSGVLA